MRDDKEKLDKIIECIDRIKEYTTDGNARFRDKVTHHYLDIDYEKVWGAVECDLDPLRVKLSDIKQRLLYKPPEDKPSRLEERLKGCEYRIPKNSTQG